MRGVTVTIIKNQVLVYFLRKPIRSDMNNKITGFRAPKDDVALERRGVEPYGCE